jgi:hypothetical protein
VLLNLQKRIMLYNLTSAHLVRHVLPCSGPLTSKEVRLLSSKLVSDEIGRRAQGLERSVLKHATLLGCSQPRGLSCYQSLPCLLCEPVLSCPLLLASICR